MAGIAGIFGAGAQNVDRAGAQRALSFTGNEKVDYFASTEMFGISVAHQSEASRSPRLAEANDFCILLDGEIVDIDLGEKKFADARSMAVECSRLLRHEGVESARRLNGSFVIGAFDLAGRSLHLISDRTGSRPFFYVSGKDFLAFSSRMEVFPAFGLDCAKAIDAGGLAELLAFGRVLGRNLLPDVKTVPSSQVLTFQDGRVRKVRYFKLGFSYGEKPGDIDENADDLARVFKQSVEKRLVGWDEVGLLISGGLDSRAVLACMPDWVTCYTVCDRRNVETRIAEKTVATKGNRHVLLKRSTDYLLEIMPSMVRICEGAYDYSHGHFEGLLDLMEESTDGVLFSGFNVDTYIKGMYLPQRSVKVRGRNIKLARPKMVAEGVDLEDELMHSLQSVFGGGAVGLDVLRPEVRREVADHPRQAIKKYIDENRDLTVTNCDYFDLLGIKDNFRIFAFPCVLSLRHHLAERCVCYDNDLLDIVMRTHPEERFDSLLWTRALAVLSEKYARIRNANTVLPPGIPGILSSAGTVMARTIYLVKLAVLRRTAPGSAWTHSIDSWHDQAEFWRSGPIAARLEQLLSDPDAMRDDLIDAGSVRNMIERHRAGKARYQRILPIVLTFLEWRRNN
jgi:asparagine synthase (glutamine-hydrolysing)